jgi:hypothetical protein
MLNGVCWAERGEDEEKWAQPSPETLKKTSRPTMSMHTTADVPMTPVERRVPVPDLARTVGVLDEFAMGGQTGV